MKNVLLLFAVLLLLSLGVNYIQWRSAEKEHNARIADNDKAQERDIKRLGQLDSANNVIQSVFSDLRLDSTEHSKTQSTLISQINALKSKVKKKPLIIQDTIIIIQDSLIADLQDERDTLYIEGGPAVQKLDSINQELKSMVVSGLARQVDLRDRLIEERAKKFGVGPYIGADWRGVVSVGVSVQYSLFKFKL